MATLTAGLEFTIPLPAPLAMVIHKQPEHPRLALVAHVACYWRSLPGGDRSTFDL